MHASTLEELADIAGRIEVGQHGERFFPTVIVPIDLLEDHDRNSNTHDEEQVAHLQKSLDRFGQYKNIVAWRGRLLAGHGLRNSARAKGWREIEVKVLPESMTEVEALALLTADNRLAQLSAQNMLLLAENLQAVADFDRDLVAVAGYADDDLAAMKIHLTNGDPASKPQPDAKPSRRRYPLDIIYTLQGADSTCCLAVQAGFMYGIQSKNYRLCAYTDVLKDQRHAVRFIDNEYTEYKHEDHLSAVEALRPKYATVRDIMSRDQCRTAGAEWYSFDQIMAWAEELRQYADNVIVIPKYDCIDDIPDHFMLGYSVPTSHGGTEVDIRRFKGRRVHLLGGSWKAQLACLATLGDGVVSLDTNYIRKQATFGSFVFADGSSKSLTDFGLPDLNNPLYAAFALSVGNIGGAVGKLFDHKEGEQ